MPVSSGVRSAEDLKDPDLSGCKNLHPRWVRWTRVLPRNYPVAIAPRLASPEEVRERERLLQWRFILEPRRTFEELTHVNPRPFAVPLYKGELVQIA